MNRPSPAPHPGRQFAELVAQRRIDEARRLAESLCEHPQLSGWAWERLAFLAMGEHRFGDVPALLTTALARPSPPPVLLGIATHYYALGMNRETRSVCLDPRLAQCPVPAIQAEVGNLLIGVADYDAAIICLRRAINLGDGSPKTQQRLGTALMFVGDLDGAEAALERSLAGADHADQRQSHWILATLRKWTPERNHVERLRALLAAAGPDAVTTANFAYSLYKELDDLGRTDEAWQALMTGCRAKRATLAYDPDAEQALFARLAAEPWSPPAASPPPPGPIPIFVIGMPRTGTTLVDRILGGHSQVVSAGELNDLFTQMRWLTGLAGEGRLDEPLRAAMASVDMSLLGARYLEQTQWRAGGHGYYIDKLPNNFVNLGYLRRALPHAKVVHLMRDPMDTCYSNLKQLFTHAYEYSYDLLELARHYDNYRGLMARWHERMPGWILDVRYEDVIADPETQARRMLDFCGLDYEPQCVEIDRNASAVATASAVQVREKIHQRGHGQWRRYAAQLEPLRQALAALGYET